MGCLGCLAILYHGLRGRHIRFHYPRRELLTFRHFRLDLRESRQTLHLVTVEDLRSVAEYGVQIASAPGLWGKVLSIDVLGLGPLHNRFRVFRINYPWSRAGGDRLGGHARLHRGGWSGLGYGLVHPHGKDRGMGRYGLGRCRVCSRHVIEVRRRQRHPVKALYSLFGWERWKRVHGSRGLSRSQIMLGLPEPLSHRVGE